MTPQAIKAEATKAGLTAVDLPTCTVAGTPVRNGSSARCFAQYMRIHALEASGGLTYSQLPRYATADGTGTNDASAASKGPNGQPLDNPARDLWVTETALSPALNTSYMAEQLSLFSLVVGIALLLTGAGFLVLVGAARSDIGARQADCASAGRGSGGKSCQRRARPPLGGPAAVRRAVRLLDEVSRDCSPGRRCGSGRSGSRCTAG
jgi:hypothetical protein